ncbi:MULTISPECIES: ATP-binding cassette domain-containing protein [Streptomyces]|uniref:ATP-binding cassette domain-containing protein n=4 Tax=Streptomyces TaxID=1883 RepID=A0A8A1US33_STRR1|nr:MULTISPECIES: ATP-binding cassette domain-containing protein [Streptomyces]KOG80435.1 ABC transporter ATP-binding protein [Kitasatospora aureofaciens]KEF06247.1 ABC transporter ATP-binding protein [Streptomyces rimosus]KEF17733.1 ABC transporter ATP-binding protein [Streptomyces rimosus]KOT44407.1 ABC transporter ATP-binding protein [Streptomyces rimosus subsp. rimosus]KOT45639.1 ABC transporter ATP-binding protein [Streptomyces sp. NRRL WC-3701]
MTTLELLGVSKVYRGGKQAVDGLTLRMGPGLLGLLGPNGAGKSSLMRIAATLTRPTAGQLRYDGEDAVRRPGPLRAALGYLPQDFGVYPNLTAREFLAYLAAAKGVPAGRARTRIGELLELLNLTEAARRPLGAYSGGMLRRVGIAQALLADPKVIIVDEPTAGLDPEERARLRNLLAELAMERVVLLSTHIVSDIESVAGDIAVVAGGRLLRRGTPEELLAAVAGQVWEVLVGTQEVAEVQARHVVSRMVRTPEGVRVRLLSPFRPYEGAVQRMPDLEDAYLATVGAGGVR